MTGIAVTIDWEHPIAPDAMNRMLALIPHRANAGSRTVRFEMASLGEARMRGPADWQIMSHDGLTIVGDVRLWNRDRLRTRAGGMSVTQGMDNRRLLIEAYRRSGIGFLDEVDGDFAFVIWDHERRRAIAVRDRFGVKPLFVERTLTGIRFATEVKQLVATPAQAVEPSTTAVAEYLLAKSLDSRQTFFEGVERIRPSTALVVESTGEQEFFYWNPVPEANLVPAKDDVAGVFREHLVEAVRHRAETSTGMVSHLTGGLDSSAIAASARIAAEHGSLDAPFSTASAVFPGHEIDESLWIDEIVASQPFDHHSFEPRIDDSDTFLSDMWVSDQPRADRIRDMWDRPTSIGVERGDDLLLTGVGGDEILHQAQLVIDRLHSGSPRRRLADARLHAAWMDQKLVSVIAQESRRAVPSSMKRSVRRLRRGRETARPGIARPELEELLEQSELELPPFIENFPSDTQQVVVGSTQHPLFGSLIEVEEARCARGGIDQSMPYLDRDLVTYIASISVDDRPFDGRSKTLVREGFAGWLPESVLNRREATVADDYLDEIFTAQLIEFRRRYPKVSQSGAEFIDGDTYFSLIEAAGAGTRGSAVREPLWAAWTLMLWLDGLDRYRIVPEIGAIPDSIGGDGTSPNL